MHLGAGRVRKEDDIDYSVGVELIKKIGDFVEKGDIVAYVYANDEQKEKEAVEMLKEKYIIGNEKIEPIKSILEIIQ